MLRAASPHFSHISLINSLAASGRANVGMEKKRKSSSSGAERTMYAIESGQYLPVSGLVFKDAETFFSGRKLNVFPVPR